MVCVGGNSSLTDTAAPAGVLGQRPKVLRISTTEAINRLIRITNHKQPMAITRQDFHESILHGIDILELVYQHIGKALAKLPRRRVVGFEPRQTIEQDIIVVTHVIGV
jgi:hypothetical protein